MGSSPSETKNDNYDTRSYEDRRTERISCSFYLGMTEVTNDQFGRFVQDSGYQGGTNTVDFQAHRILERWRTHRGPGRPTTFVSWDDAHAFCRWLTGKENKVYRLPTEREWEYACRAGSSAAYCFGENVALLGEYAWYKENSSYMPHKVGLARPNVWGVFDMHGNVWEWCEDRPPAAAAEELEEIGHEVGTSAIIRGGSYGNGVASCRSAKRSSSPVMKRSPRTGFRVVYDPNMDTEEALSTSNGKE